MPTEQIQPEGERWNTVFFQRKSGCHANLQTVRKHMRAKCPSRCTKHGAAFGVRIQAGLRQQEPPALLTGSSQRFGSLSFSVEKSAKNGHQYTQPCAFGQSDIYQSRTGWISSKSPNEAEISIDTKAAAGLRVLNAAATNGSSDSFTCPRCTWHEPVVGFAAKCLIQVRFTWAGPREILLLNSLHGMHVSRGPRCPYTPGRGP